MTTNTRHDLAVTISHAEANDILDMLRDMVDSNTTTAKRSKNAAVRDYCERKNDRACELRKAIIERMYQWTTTTEAR